MIGVFVGHGQTRGLWKRDERIVVHVVRKLHENHLDRRELLPRRIGGLRLDVIEVGAARTHALDISDQVASPGARPRTGTFTALVPHPDGALAVLSGHVGLPWRAGSSIARRYDSTVDPPFSLRSVDTMSGQAFVSRVLRAALTPWADWAVARAEDAVGHQLDPTNPMTGTQPPFPFNRQLAIGDRVQHFSRLEGRILHGAVSHFAEGPVEFALDDGTLHRYGGIAVVRGVGGAFSRGGESGSLVFDRFGRAVGIVLGGTDTGSLSYLLAVETLRGPLGPLFDQVFVEGG